MRWRGRELLTGAWATGDLQITEAGQRSWLSGRTQRNGQNEFYGQAHPADQ